MNQKYQGISEVVAQLNSSKKPLQVYLNTETNELFTTPGRIIELGTFPPNFSPFDAPYEEHEIEELASSLVQELRTMVPGY